MNTLSRLIVLAVVLTMVTSRAEAQELRYDVDFEGYFDNREYSVMKGSEGRSGTDFAVRLLPKVGLEFAENSTLYLGVDLVELMGGASTSSLFNSVSPIIYYGYDSELWSTSIGAFERGRMREESYSTAFFSDDYLFYDNTIEGVMGRYSVGDSFVEFVCDWEGQKSTTTREKFRLLSAGRYDCGRLFVGYNLSVTHFAGQEAEHFDNVVDNCLVNPAVGARWQGRWGVETRLSYLQSLQRDRSYENVWLTPAMGEAALKISHRGFSLDERIYIGDNLMPLYGGHMLDDGTYVEYGEQLYTGDPFFATEGGYYNRAALSYKRSLFGDMLAIGAEFVTHITSGGFGTEQLLKVNLKLGGRLYKWNNIKE